MESRWEGILASIFNGFWWILAAKLGPSWEGKSSQDRPRQAKTGQDKGSEGKGEERKRKGREGYGEVWKSVESDLLRPGGGWFARPLGGDLPRTQDPGWRASLGILVATFLAISLLFFFASFFDAFLGRSWLRFPSQLASQNRPKSKKNRYQDAIHLGLRFFIDFYRFLLPTSTPQSQLNASRLAFS